MKCQLCGAECSGDFCEVPDCGGTTANKELEFIGRGTGSQWEVGPDGKPVCVNIGATQQFKEKMRGKVQ